jgi:hypothetical protein
MPEITFTVRWKHRKTKVTSPTDSATPTLLQLSVHFFSVIPTVSMSFAISVRIFTADFHFLPMEASDIEGDVIIQFLVGGLVIHYTGLFHVFSCGQKLVKNFMLLQQLRSLFNFWELI